MKGLTFFCFCHRDLDGQRRGTSRGGTRTLRGGDMGPQGAAIWDLEGRRTDFEGRQYGPSRAGDMGTRGAAHIGP